MSLVIHDVQTVEQMEVWKPVILLALEEIGARSGGRYSSERVFEHLCLKITDRLRNALWIAVDENKLADGIKSNDAACGVMTLELHEDEIGSPVCVISRGWVKKGYRGEPFDAALPSIKTFARHRNCTRIISMTERSSMSVASKRFDLKYQLRRLEGLAAYQKWIGRKGFRMRETLFELELT